MELRERQSLQKMNSFNVKSTSSAVYLLKTLVDLEQLPDVSLKPFYILGEGSNSLFVDKEAPVIIKPEFKGIEISDTDENFIVSVGAGENWHNLVNTCLNRKVYGLENLALIPGSVGAAPVQNIGAYGVELSDFCLQVLWYEFSSKTIKSLSNSDCQFSYRNSIFKGELYNKGIITQVVFSFPKQWQANLGYSGLSVLDEMSTAKQIMEQVIHLRQTKLPDPKTLPNAGSFFKNPQVSEDKMHELENIYTDIPNYPQGNGLVKLAAGWLIEKAGLKGYAQNGVSVHHNQALVLVNNNSEHGKDIVVLAKMVQQRVFEKFNILLSPEVRVVTAQGEQCFDDLAL